MKHEQPCYAQIFFKSDEDGNPVKKIYLHYKRPNYYHPCLVPVKPIAVTIPEHKEFYMDVEIDYFPRSSKDNGIYDYVQQVVDLIPYEPFVYIAAFQPYKETWKLKLLRLFSKSYSKLNIAKYNSELIDGLELSLRFFYGDNYDIYDSYIEEIRADINNYPKTIFQLGTVIIKQINKEK